MRAAISGLVFAAAIATAAPVVQANPFWGAVTQPGALRWDGGANGYSTVSIRLQGYNGSSFWNVSAGEFKGYFDPTGEDATSGFEADDFFRFFCVDLKAYANASANSYARQAGVSGSGDADDTTDAAQLSRLFDQHFPNPATGVFFAGGPGPTNFGSFTTTQVSAAFQLAVWEIWYDKDMNLGTGDFQAKDNNGVAALAQQWLTAVGPGSTYADGWRLYTFANEKYQDYLSATYSEPRRQVPLPGTLALFGIAAAAAGFVRRKRNA